MMPRVADERRPSSVRDDVASEAMPAPRLLRDPNLHISFGVTLMAVLGVSSITPAFPRIVRDLGITEVEVGWLVTVFTLPGVVLTPVLGILADRWGRKRVLVPSLLLFGVAGTACAFARSFELLLLLRGMQGVGAAALGALNVTILGDLFAGPRMMTAMGYNATVLSVGTALYPAIGGALAGIAWHWPFALPAIALPLALWVLFRLQNPEPKNGMPVGRYLRELLVTLRDRRILGLFVSSLLTFVLLYGAILTYLPLFLDRRFGLSTTRIGLLLSVMSVASGLVSLSLGRLEAAFGSRSLMRTGMLLYAASLALMPWAPSPTLLALLGALYGAANGMTIPTFIGKLSSLAPTERRGAVMSLNGMVLRMGQTLGPLVMGAAAVAWGLDSVFYLGAVIALGMVAIVMTLVRPDASAS
jgi:MFS transporter, ACDE family, multidrug resistance protein